MVIAVFVVAVAMDVNVAVVEVVVRASCDVAREPWAPWNQL